MLRRLGAIVAAAALLSGLAAAPYVHAHHGIESMGDEHHPHGMTLVHAHAAPHSHHHDDDAELGTEAGNNESDRTWSVDSFLFPQSVSSPGPAPALLVSGIPPVELTSVWLGAHRIEPSAHGPPLNWRLPLRAPPVFLPAHS